MNYELGFLCISTEYQQKEMYLQHINEMHNIKVPAGCTYNELFAKLRSSFDRDYEKHKAAEAWISHNIDSQNDSSVWDASICKEDSYAAFNLIKID